MNVAMHYRRFFQRDRKIEQVAAFLSLIGRVHLGADQHINRIGADIAMRLQTRAKTRQRVRV
jgi:hypothetical protein